MPTLSPSAVKELFTNTFNAIANDQAIVELAKSETALVNWVNTLNPANQLLLSNQLASASPRSVGIDGAFASGHSTFATYRRWKW
jgi:hypothetical protein